jgi:hypothetical protein
MARQLTEHDSLMTSGLAVPGRDCALHHWRIARRGSVDTTAGFPAAQAVATLKPGFDSTDRAFTSGLQLSL